MSPAALVIAETLLSDGRILNSLNIPVCGNCLCIYGSSILCYCCMGNLPSHKGSCSIFIFVLEHVFLEPRTRYVLCLMWVFCKLRFLNLVQYPNTQEVKGAGAGLTAAVLLAMVNYIQGSCTFIFYSFYEILKLWAAF